MHNSFSTDATVDVHPSCRTIEVAIKRIDDAYFRIVDFVEKMRERQLDLHGTVDDECSHFRDQLYALSDVYKAIYRYLENDNIVGLDELLEEMQYDLENGIEA